MPRRMVITHKEFIGLWWICFIANIPIFLVKLIAAFIIGWISMLYNGLKPMFSCFFSEWDYIPYDNKTMKLKWHTRRNQLRRIYQAIDRQSEDYKRLSILDRYKMAYRRVNLPADARRYSSLKDLGLYVNDQDKIANFDHPERGYWYLANKNDRYNEIRHEDYEKACRDMVDARLKEIGMMNELIPTRYPNEQPPERSTGTPGTPIWFSEYLYEPKKIRRLVVLISKPHEDPQIISRHLWDSKGVNAGSPINFVKDAHLRKDLGVMIANPAQRYWSRTQQRAMTHRSWMALARDVGTDPNFIMEALQNIVGNSTPREHFQTLWESHIEPFIKAGSKSFDESVKTDVYFICVGEAIHPLLACLTGEWETRYSHNVASIVSCNGHIDPEEEFKFCPEFENFWKNRCMSFVLDDQEFGTPLLTERLVPNCLSSGIQGTGENIFNAAYTSALDWFDILYESENPDLVLPSFVAAAGSKVVPHRRPVGNEFEAQHTSDLHFERQILKEDMDDYEYKNSIAELNRLKAQFKGEEKAEAEKQALARAEKLEQSLAKEKAEREGVAQAQEPTSTEEQGMFRDSVVMSDKKLWDTFRDDPVSRVKKFAQRGLEIITSNARTTNVVDVDQSGATSSLPAGVVATANNEDVKGKGKAPKTNGDGYEFIPTSPTSPGAPVPLGTNGEPLRGILRRTSQFGTRRNSTTKSPTSPDERHSRPASTYAPSPEFTSPRPRPSSAYSASISRFTSSGDPADEQAAIELLDIAPWMNGSSLLSGTSSPTRSISSASPERAHLRSTSPETGFRSASADSVNRHRRRRPLSSVVLASGEAVEIGMDSDGWNPARPLAGPRPTVVSPWGIAVSDGPAVAEGTKGSSDRARSVSATRRDPQSLLKTQRRSSKRVSVRMDGRRLQTIESIADIGSSARSQDESDDKTNA